MNEAQETNFGDWRQKRPAANARAHLWVVCALLLMSGCRSTPEVTKIGLIAPFEGLYRESGYSALATMRGALADAGAAELAILPLALDDGDDPLQARRTAQKLRADPTVAAVIGPLTPWAAAGAADELSALANWITPFALTPDAGFVDPDLPAQWADAWAAATAEAIQRHGHERLVVAGWTPGWPEYTAAEWATVVGMSVAVSDDPLAVGPSDAVLWLGSAADGAAYLNELREANEDASLWLGSQAANPVFDAHANHPTNVYWTIWTTVEYNPGIAPNFPAAPDAQLIYIATRQALQQLTPTSSSTPAQWQLQVFELLADGESVPAPAD